jgi:hypothetical protein
LSQKQINGRTRHTPNEEIEEENEKKKDSILINGYTKGKITKLKDKTTTMPRVFLFRGRRA